jgi:hypothetical protein
VTLAPRQTSPALREELFYDNVYLREWVARGLVLVLDAKMTDVWAREGLEPPGVTRQTPAAAAPAATGEDAAPPERRRTERKRK